MVKQLILFYVGLWGGVSGEEPVVRRSLVKDQFDFILSW